MATNLASDPDLLSRAAETSGPGVWPTISAAWVAVSERGTAAAPVA